MIPVRSGKIFSVLALTEYLGRVLSLFSSRRNGTPPTPHPQASVPPGGRVPIPTRRHTLWYSLFMYFVLALLVILSPQMKPPPPHPMCLPQAY